MRALTWIVGAAMAVVVLRLTVQASLAILLLVIAIALVRAPGNTLKVLAALLLLEAFAGHPTFALMLMVSVLCFSVSCRR